MIRKTIQYGSLALLAGLLTACGNGKDNAMDYNDNTQPIGMYSNEHDGKNKDHADNDGPITEMMDGDRNDRPTRVSNNSNMDNQGVPIADNDRNENGYYSDRDQNLAEKVSDKISKMKNVDDARTVVTEDNVIVAVDTNDKNNKNVKNAIIKETEKLANGRNVDVFTDEGSFNRVKQIDTNIKNNKPRETIDADIKDFMKNTGKTIQRTLNPNR
ncbi:YhcN/YlaJ family sporulation lipoprotein [Metabacillus sp. KIGAM252]|uniref:YhcN/YlaJ family sporulation lipoprotein n=1 Tax=Metabacillus flavus TaxID=2823519 RepID=A0ABS5LGI9_9BACI|nr:YhcN/YlaJ family sporulation lipoprotein [Metabacillus flavus]MBS2969855.1 YhcN/YlaJ family sporulation lipoprotein [Metabacillus flavus]